MGRILFDMGATHCFIATRFARTIGLLDTAKSTVTCVDSPLSRGSVISLICRGVGIEIGRFTLPADMLVLEMTEYDAIVGMVG